MVEIPFPTNSSVGETNRTTNGRLVNAILEQLPGGDVIRKRAPGLYRVGASIDDKVHCRGMVMATTGSLLVAYDDRVQLFTGLNQDAVTDGIDVGALDGTDTITIAKNNKTPVPDIVAVTDNGAFTLSTGAAPASYPDPDVGSPNSVCFGDGYFFFTYGDGSCLASALNDTAINPLDVVKLQSKSDGLLRGVFFRQELFLMGPSVIEVWSNTANPTGFPFSRAAVIPRGLMSKFAVAGFEDGFTNQLIWVGSDNIVYMLDGMNPKRISTHDIERAIQSLADKETLRAFVFMNGGHAYWVIKSSDWTWVYDLMTSTWQERKSWQLDYFRAECSVNGFGRWILGDGTTGYLFTPDATYYQEDQDPLPFMVMSLSVDKFPARYTVAKTDFDFVVGEADIALKPEARIAWSDDGGVQFSNPLVRKIGEQGKYKTRITLNRTGQATGYGRVWRIEISDAVYIGLLGGQMTASMEME